jgi:hypothetical protein
MEMKAGNKALREHKEKGKRVYLFTAAKDKNSGLVTYWGEVEYVGHEKRQTKDMNGDLRSSFIFKLRPIGWSHPDTPLPSWFNRAAPTAKSTTAGSKSGGGDETTGVGQKRKDAPSNRGAAFAGVGSPSISGSSSSSSSIGDKKSKVVEAPPAFVPLVPPDEKQIQALVQEMGQTDRRAEEMDLCVWKIFTALSGTASSGRVYVPKYSA